MGDDLGKFIFDTRSLLPGSSLRSRLNTHLVYIDMAGYFSVLFGIESHLRI